MSVYKRTYFQLFCDHHFPNRRCDHQTVVYTQPGSEGAPSEAMARTARALDWTVKSRGRREGYDVFCPEHKPARGKP